ncbi:MAG: hypothetical protein ACKO7P_06735 [Bacteroidota bacterium]
MALLRKEITLGTVFEKSFINKHMKNIFTLLLLSLATFANAQKTQYDDLLSLFVDEKYVKCLQKAESYTLSDKTKGHPLPFLFVSRCYYEISKIDDAKMKEDYANAGKDCFTYISKYFQAATVKTKDKNCKECEPALSYKDEARVDEFKDYFLELRKLAYSQFDLDADVYEKSKNPDNKAEVKDFKKNLSTAKTMSKTLMAMDFTDAGAQLIYGFALESAKDEKATGYLNKAKVLLTKENYDNYDEEQQKALKRFLIFYLNVLQNEGKNSSASEWAKLGDAIFKGDAEYKSETSSISR